MAAPPRPPALQNVLALLHELAADLPETEHIKFSWDGPDGPRLKLSLAGCLPPPPPPAPLPALTETEQTVVDAIGSGPDLSGEEIAEKTGYTFDGWFRSQLASMRKRGILSGEARSPGYGVATCYRS